LGFFLIVVARARKQAARLIGQTKDLPIDLASLLLKQHCPAYWQWGAIDIVIK